MHRVVVVLLAAACVMLTVVVLRTETARLNREISELDREEMRLREQVRAAEIELARLRNPILLRQRVAQDRLERLTPDVSRGSPRADDP
ncbi:MAG: hypothetical protein D6744_15325 [Planctomycetota bacterium]|nr:MAG: hypothetical protein D6744_15325 [Planctomycetota bacterium]